MGYSSRTGKRPAEYASKSAHSHVINDASVQAFLEKCRLPNKADEIDCNFLDFEPDKNNPITHVIAIDGGYTEVAVRKEFPSATFCFFQFGALMFEAQDLQRLQDAPFIDPADIAKLKQIQRFKLPLPTKNISFKDEGTLTQSVRKAIFDFFLNNPKDEELKFIDSLKWFVFGEYNAPEEIWLLSRCPLCETATIPLARAQISKQMTFQCPHCKGDIYLTDVFRLHEVVDDTLGASGILGYLTTTIEQIIIVHLINLILATTPKLLGKILFIKDGPLAFFGQTANMHKPMRRLVDYLFSKHNLYLAGLEKSGAFVEHAHEISNKIKGGSYLPLNNEYIYRYVIPGIADSKNPYGSTTYYGNKLIFKTNHGRMYVVTMPMPEILDDPSSTDFRNLSTILTNLEMLKCDMYDNSLLPVALANKLVSLANHPSSRILQKFAVKAIK